MNNSILRKVIDELSKEQPNLDYIRGMLETLAEMQEPEPVGSRLTAGRVALNHEMVGPTPSSPADLDEGELLDAKARAMMPGVAAMAAKSTELG